MSEKTGRVGEAGKGSRQRPRLVPEEYVAKVHVGAFGVRCSKCRVKIATTLQGAERSGVDLEYPLCSKCQ